MPCGRVFGAEVAVEEGLTGSLALVAVGLDLLGGGGVSVGTTGSDELLSPGMVDGFAFGLEIGGGGTANDGAFVPVEAEPFEGVFD